jgi:hypothetical protein
MVLNLTRFKLGYPTLGFMTWHQYQYPAFFQEICFNWTYHASHVLLEVRAGFFVCFTPKFKECQLFSQINSCLKKRIYLELNAEYFRYLCKEFIAYSKFQVPSVSVCISDGKKRGT